MALEQNRGAGRQRSTARSVRLAPDEDARLRRAAKAMGTTPSDLMREAVLARCDALLNDENRDGLEDIIGAIDVPGFPAREAKALVGAMLDDKLAKRRRLP